ncbi:phage integrase N-terminal SAM-like domain-containing protein [Leptolyngbya sp. FACHB-261]|uniref:phage integrase N-terminal SAM-like domain-containing protein n=1 Tax=Leptolyngbya sp. FACHB-261 TaxID=2692806 RepID=UPI001F54C87E|nr:phage integrase N-terminal SAM-like domain-containing protein [Leptolyngbya sp. FACHB-261]
MFHNECHPAEISTAEVTRFLTCLVVNEHVVSTPQNQALNAVLCGGELRLKECSVSQKY